MVTTFPLIASPIVELNIQLTKILVLKLFLPSTKTSLTAIACVAGYDSNFMILISGYLHE